MDAKKKALRSGVASLSQESADEIRRRVHLVILIRWALAIGLLAVTLVEVLVLRAGRTLPVSQSLRDASLAVAAAMALFSLVSELTYRRFGQGLLFRYAQIIFDVAAVTYLVHFRGGVMSELWALYVVFTLEATLILMRPLHVMAVAAFAAGAYVTLLTAEFTGFAPVMPEEFAAVQRVQDLSVVAQRSTWILGLIFLSAFLSTEVMAKIREREVTAAATDQAAGFAGLHNYHFFYDRLSDLIERAGLEGGSVSLVLLNVDNLAELNERHGRGEGDRVLETVSGACRSLPASAAPNETESACRLGGDQFAIILPRSPSRTRSDAIRRLAEDKGATAVARRISELVMQQAGERGASLSAGIATYPSDAATLDGLVAAANAALREAKTRGGNRTVLASALRDRAA